jgi:hypothetical protein
MTKPTTQHEPDQEVADLSFQTFEDPRANEVLEQMRRKLCNEFGVTVVGPYLTLRWSDGRHHVEASFQCTRIEHSGILTPHDPEYNK